MDMVCLQNRLEEIRERRDEASEEVVHEDGVVPVAALAAIAGRLHARGAVLVGVRGHKVAHLVDSPRPMRDFGSATAGSALPETVAGWLACTRALPFLGAAVFGGAMDAKEKRSLEALSSRKKEEFGGRVRRRNGRSDRRHHHTQALTPRCRGHGGPHRVAH